MIKQYTDHSANERTFLAWVRTAIAVMAFGFLLERFDLFLKIAMVTPGSNGQHFPATGFGQVAGLAMLLLGAAMAAIAAIRFLRTRRAIDSPEQHEITGLRLDVALAALLAVLGLALAFYLAHAILSYA